MYTQHFGLYKAVFEGGIAQNDDLFLGQRQQRVAANLKIGLTMRDAVVTLKAAYQPHGINVGINLGKAAGAGVPDHLHVHVMPRWSGDTNFMTAVAEARVLPESLADVWQRLSAAWPTP